MLHIAVPVGLPVISLNLNEYEADLFLYHFLSRNRYYKKRGYLLPSSEIYIFGARIFLSSDFSIILVIVGLS